MKNIIAFSGTHGTGKSTCAYRLASKLKLEGHNIALIDEIARECPFEISKKATNSTQYWILSAQMQRELILTSKYELVIADRSIVDTIAYGVVLELLEPDVCSFFCAVYKGLL